MNLLKMNSNGQITIPADVRKRFHLHGGDYFQIQIEKNTLKFSPAKVIDPGQDWFWSKEWQDKEKEAEEDIRKGHYKKFNSTGEALKHLESLCK